MNVCITPSDGTVLWSHTKEPYSPNCTASAYLKDGTQNKIIAALSAALYEANAQLRCVALQEVNAVPDVGTSATKINRDIPIAIVWNRDTGR